MMDTYTAVFCPKTVFLDTVFRKIVDKLEISKTNNRLPEIEIYSLSLLGYSRSSQHSQDPRKSEILAR